jgi:hypothetical protein
MGMTGPKGLFTLVTEEIDDRRYIPAIPAMPAMPGDPGFRPI